MASLGVRVRILLVCAGCLVPGALAWLAAQQTTRDTPSPSAGTGVVSGTVITDEQPGKPIRRALVTLAPMGQGSATTVVTDDAGRFAFAGIVAGRYTLNATRPGYSSGSYGATRPARSGTPLQVGNDQSIRNLVVRIWRGAVITGTIRDQNGEPLPSARVSLAKYVYAVQNGQRTLQQTGGAATTDDRGVYRIFGIAPGEYFVQLGVPISLGSLRLTTDQSVQSALQAGRGGSAEIVEGPPMTFAPVFYPGTTSISSATPITVAAGEERLGIDMQLQLVPTARIEGVVVNPDGSPAPGAQLSVVGTEPIGNNEMSAMSNLAAMFGNRPRPDGSFSIPGIAPGQYTVVARTGSIGRMPTAPGAPAAPATGAPPAMWATSEVIVSGQDINGLRLQLEPGVTVSGRVAFESAGNAPPDPSAMRITLSPILTGGAVAPVAQPVQPDAQGNFSVSNVTPGRYRFTATPSAARGAGPGAVQPSLSGWALKSAAVKGRETLDAGLDVRPGDGVTDVILTLTNHPTTVSGVLQDGSGRPAPDYFIILYSADRAFWTPPSRRVVMAHPGSDGRFAFRNVPAGDYLLAAATDVDQGEWMDPAFLSQFVPASIRISVAEGETKTQDIRIAGGR